MSRPLGKLLALFDRRQRWKLAGILAMNVVLALLEVAGIASIMPFISVLADPNAVAESRWLTLAYQGLGFETVRSFHLFLGVSVLALVFSSIAFSALAIWVMVRFAASMSYRFSVQLLSWYVHAPYELFLTRNSATLTRNVLSEVLSITSGILFPTLLIVGRGLIAIVIIALLLLVDPVLALTLAVVIGTTYLLLYRTLHRRIYQLGQTRYKANEDCYKSVAEVLGGIKDIKILGREDAFLRQYSMPAHRLRNAIVTNQLMASMPRYAMEGIAFGGLMLMLLYLIVTNGEMTQILPVISVFAMAAYRLLPAFQVIFANLTQVRFSLPVLNNLHGELRQAVLGQGSDPTRRDDPPIDFEHQIAFRAASYTYPTRETAALRDIDLRIPKYATVGFVGATGSGKTTAADLILGLITPQSGAIEIDGQPLTPGLARRWQRRLGYVPQHIFLADDTIARNIAFGIPPGQVDPQRLQWAAAMAHLPEFVDKLPQGLETTVGDRGIRLSGGQRQRIGIARALYYDPDVLILDEATSAVDNVTETLIMDSVRQLSGQKTIIMIAHRLTTVMQCDTIYFFEDGAIVDAGSYEQLIDQSESFRRLARVTAG